MHAPPVTSYPIWIAAAERTERLERSRRQFVAYWGESRHRIWGTGFEARIGDVRIGLTTYILPLILISWSVQAGSLGSSNGGQYGIDWLIADLAVFETRELAAELGLDVADWLAGALAVCECDPRLSPERLG